MFNTTHYKSSIVLIALLVLSACGGGGGGGSNPSTPSGGPAVTTISGTATAPSGTVAMFENKSIMLAITDFFFPPASAVITGLEPVKGALVELIEIDNTGNQVGDVLASTHTSITGDYNISLPSGINLAANLVVRISGTGTDMRSQVVEQTVDISPVSEFVLRNFIEHGTDLATLPVNMVATLKGHAEEFDLAAASDMTTMITALEDTVGKFVDDSITAISAEPGAASAIAGNIHHGDFDLGFKYMADPMVEWTDISQTSSTSTGVAALLNDGGNSFGIGAFGGESQAYTQLQTQDFASYWIWYELSTWPGDGEQLHNAGTVDANNNLSYIWPFEENFWDDLSYGERSPPAAGVLYAAGIPNTYVETSLGQYVIYRLIDTDGDGTNDALDPAAPVGHDSDFSISLVTNQSAGVSLAALNGNYGSVYMAEFTNSGSGLSGLVSGVVDSSIDSTGHLTETAEDAVLLQRTPNGDGSVSLAESPVTGPSELNTGTFTLTGSNGAFTYVEDGDTASYFGFSSSNGEVSFMALTDSTQVDDGFGGTIINSTTMGFVIAVKKPTTTPNLSGRTFRLMGIEKTMDSNGELVIERVRGDDDRLVFSADGLQVTEQLNGLDELKRIDDISDFTETSSTDSSEVTVDVTFATDGAISFTETNAVDGYTREWKGHISESGNMIILNVIHRKDDGSRIGEGVYIAASM